MSRFCVWPLVVVFTLFALIESPTAHAQEVNYSDFKYVDEDYPPPLASFGIRAGILAPYHMVNIGVSTSIVLHELLYTEFALLYGMGIEDDKTGSSGSLYAEGVAGYPLFSWDGSTSGGLTVSQTNSGGYLVTEYIPMDIPTIESLIVEGGFQYGSFIFSEGSAAGEYSGFAHFSAGLRYRYDWNSTLIDGTKIRAFNAVWAHALLGGFGAPYGDETFVLDCGLTCGDPKALPNNAIGWKAGLRLNAWLDSFGALVVEVGNLPTLDLFYFNFSIDIDLFAI